MSLLGHIDNMEHNTSISKNIKKGKAATNVCNIFLCYKKK